MKKFLLLALCLLSFPYASWAMEDDQANPLVRVVRKSYKVPYTQWLSTHKIGETPQFVTATVRGDSDGRVDSHLEFPPDFPEGLKNLMVLQWAGEKWIVGINYARDPDYIEKAGEITNTLMVSPATISSELQALKNSMEQEVRQQIAPIASSTSAVLDDGYRCLFDKGGPISDPDDPYQMRSTTLSPRFLSRHPAYEFPTQGGLVLGAYQIDTEMQLGYGDDGVVYLARHVPTDIYVAAKFREMVFQKEEMHDEYRRLRSLGQLFSAWCKSVEVTPTRTNSYAYLMIPFVDGETISSYYHPWIKTTLNGNRFEFSDLSAGMRLLKSMVSQLNYIAARGALHDPTSGNILITNDHQHVVLIDFGYSGDLTKSSSIILPSLSPSEFNVSSYADFSHCFFGTRNYLDQVKDHRIEEPSGIVNFLRALPKPYTPFYLDDFNTAFQTLETQV